MIRAISIKNFKSIFDDSFELGRVNVFIGENGCGKSNILEAVGMAGTTLGGEAKSEELYYKGIRVAKPNLTFSSFLGVRGQDKIEIGMGFTPPPPFQPKSIKLNISATDPEDIYTNWENDFPFTYLHLLRRTELSPDVASALIQESYNFLRSGKEANPSKVFRKFGLPNFSQLAKDISQTLENYQIYSLESNALRGITSESQKKPLGTHGESLDILLSTFSEQQWEDLLSFEFISWLDEVVIDKQDALKFEGHKLGRSNSLLYFRDKFMRKNNNVFSAENANEGALHILAYLALFISQKAPKFFAIDNIENGLNPQLCRELIKQIGILAEKHDKQVLITTHNPAILDGLNLHDDEQRLFVVARNDEGHTVTERVEIKPDVEVGGQRLKLSELWMRGFIGGLPKEF